VCEDQCVVIRIRGRVQEAADCWIYRVIVELLKKSLRHLALSTFP